MSLRRRLLRLLAIALGVILFAGYFAFSTFLFNPLEDDLEADLSILVPRDVDFFVAKAGLQDDFSRFPRLAVMDRLERTAAWQELSDSPELYEWAQQVGLEQALAEMDALRAQLRGFEPLDVFGGEDVALAGFFRGADLQAADWAAYGRANWLGKLGVALLSYPGLLGLEGQGLSVAEVGDELYSLEGPALARKLFVTRLRDVVIAGSSQELVGQSAELLARQGQDSFGQSARYFDHIQNVERSSARDELELFVDTRALTENLQLSGRWPDAQSQDWFPAFAGRLFQAGAVKEVVGVVGFEGGLGLDVHGEFSSELITAEQKRLFRIRGFEQGTLVGDAARLAQANSAWFAYTHTDVGELLLQMYLALSTSDRDLIDSQINATREYSGGEEIIGLIGSIFRNRAAVVVRDNDYEYAETDPPNDGAPVPAVAVALWFEPGEKPREDLEALRSMVIKNQQSFGIQGREPGSRGVFRHRVAGGFEVWEFWNPVIPGSGHVAVVTAGDVFVISNSFRMLEEVIKTYREGPPSFPRLADRPDFRALVSTTPPTAGFALWIDPRSLAAIFRKQVPDAARNTVMDSVDWASERRVLEDRVLRERFPDQRRGALTPDVQQELNDAVNPLLLERRAQLEEQQIPLARARLERRIRCTEVASAALATLSIDPKVFELALRVVVPLEE